MSAVFSFISANTVAPADTSHLLVSTLLALLAVLALMISLAWLVKRIPGSALAPTNQIKMLAHLNLGQRDRLLIIEVGHQHLLLGITSQHIHCLHVLPEPLLTSSVSSAPALSHFAQFMRKKSSKNTAKAD